MKTVSKKQSELNYEIETVVIKMFWAILKKRKMYFALRRLLPSKTGSYKIWGGSKSPHGPFFECENINDIAKKLTDLTVEVGITTDVRKMDKYDRVTADINHLLHFCVEHSLSMEAMSQIGQEVFDMSNFALFGDKIEEQINEPSPIEPTTIDHRRDVGIVLGRTPENDDNDGRGPISWDNIFDFENGSPF